MFDHLSTRLQTTFRNLTGRGRVTEASLQEALREIRLALLEADVAVPVVKDLLARVREKALGEEVLRSLTPGQQVVAIVRDELVALLGGGRDAALRLTGPVPAVVLLVGLQGSGKTTTTGKLALMLRKQGRNPLMVPADVTRPAARLQLIQIARQSSLAAFEGAEGAGDPREICRAALSRARQVGFDILLVDTAGRLHIDDELMAELTDLKKDLSPVEVLFVADAMTGQDAVRSAREFNERVGLTGVILTKLDGDARGGAALSVAAVADVPVKLAGTGEKIAELEAFHPDRMAGRILGMGDVLTLIERAEETIEQEEAQQLERKLRRNDFTLEDFRDQLRRIRRMGSLTDLLGMIPGMSHLQGAEVDQKELTRVEAIINSMTPGEREDHRVLNASRRRRISRGSGTSVQDVNRIVKQFATMKRMVRSLGSARGGRPGRWPRGMKVPKGFRGIN